MLNIIKLFIIFANIIFCNSSFELGLWRGFTNIYSRNRSNILDFSKPFLTTYNYSNNLNKILNLYFKYNYSKYLNDNKFKYKFELNDISGFYINVDKNINKNYCNKINIYHNTERYIINIDYNSINQTKFQLNSISISNLYCGLVKIYKIKRRNLNISSLLLKLKKWNYCKSTIINIKNIYHKEIKEIYGYDYEYFFKNKNYISFVFIDKLIISIPEIIDDNKAFTMLYGCLMSDDCYKQLNLNYNFNGHLVSFELNEYEPFNFTKKIDNFLETFKAKLNNFILQ